MKKKFKISIENKKGIMKKLDPNINLSQLRNLLKNEIDDNYVFVEEDDLKILKEDENEITLEEIIINENQIHIKLKNDKPKIYIYLNENIFEEIESDENINLDNLRKISKKMNDDYIFVSNDGFEIEKENENEFQIKDIIDNNIIKIKCIKHIESINKIEKQVQNIIDKITIMNNNEQKFNLFNIELDINLKQLRQKCGNNISDAYYFLLFGEKIIKEKEENIMVSNIIDKNNCIYIQKIEANENEYVNNDLDNYLEQIESLFIFYKNYIPEYIPELDKNGIKEEFDFFNQKYKNMKGLKRFAIPIFGVISSGKSTLLNYLLNLRNILEMGEGISTQFICIIRNNKGLKHPKLYTAKLDERDKYCYNFIKDELIKGDIKSIISEKNKKFKDTDKINRNPAEHFLIIETDIPFLNNINSDFSDLFEFLDFPGLNEQEESKTNLFFKDYLPLILPNIKFSIFIFEIDNFEGKGSEKILNNYENFSEKFPYLREYCQESIKNSIFILNKIDKIDNDREKKEQLNLFRKKFKNYNFNENNSFVFSSKLKLLESNKFNSFYNFTEYIIEDKKNENCPDFLKYLNQKLEEELNVKIENFDNIINKNVEEDELIKYNQLIEKTSFDIVEPFNSEQYLFYKHNFLNNSPKNIKFEDNTLTSLFKNKMKQIYDDFVDLSNFKKTLELIKKNNENSIKNNESFSNMMKDAFDELFIKNKRIYNSSELNKFNDFIIQNMEHFLEIAKDGNLLLLNKLKEEVSKFKLFLNSDEISFKILILGQYSSGKSSLLNSIIGYNLDLLDFGNNHCTKKAFIIKYCESKEDISLTSADIQKNDFSFYYFKVKEELAKGIDNVKLKIKELNNFNSCSIEYYILKTPIEFFDLYNFSDDIKKHIEFIDLPGLDTSNYSEIIFQNEKMIDFMDGLIYVNKGGFFGKEEDTSVIANMINQIRENKINCSFDTLYFVYAKADEYCEISLESFKNDILKILNQKLENENFCNILKQNKIIKNKDEFLVSNFSNSIYHEYQDLKFLNLKYTSLEDLYNDIKERAKINEEELTIYSFNESKLIKAKEMIINKFYINNNQWIDKLAKIHLYISDNKHKIRKYQKSNATQFFDYLKIMMSNVERNYNYFLTNNYKNFILENIFSPVLMLEFTMYKHKPKFLQEEEINKRILNVVNFKKKCLDNNSKLINDMDNLLDEEFKELKTFCGKDEFEEKKKIFDEKMKTKIDLFKNNLSKNISEFNQNCYIEVQKIEIEVFGVNFSNFYFDLTNFIDNNEMGEKASIASLSIAGAIFGGLGTYGIICSSSLAFPIIGLVIGGIYAVSFLGSLGYRMYQGRKKREEEYINIYYNSIKKDIKNISTKIVINLGEMEDKYINRIKLINDLKLENPENYIKKKEIFEKQLNELFDLIKNMIKLELN